MNLLHIDSSILGANSVSRQLSASIVVRMRSGAPDLKIMYRDLAADPVAHLSGAYLAAKQNVNGEHPPALRADLAGSGDVLESFLSADIVVIGAGLYNFTIPSQLKAWVDRILIAGRTFRYDAQGRPEGLAGKKRIIVALARGNFYGPGAPAQAFEHGVTYLRTVFGFIGIYSPEFVIAEGLAVGPEQRAAGIADAERQIASLPT